MMKRGPQQRLKKALSAKGLLDSVRKTLLSIFQVVSTGGSSKGRPRTITLVDALMSALAMFGLKSPSLLAFDQAIKDETTHHNLGTLYGVTAPPSDTHMRKMLDEIDPRLLRGTFLQVFEEAQRGKLLERYQFLDGYLLAVDGTQIFQSEEVHCECCCQKRHQDGRITYHHQILGAAIVHPSVRTVIPLCPEPITKQDGATKNDCESNAGKRFLDDLKRDHPKLKLTIVWDAIAANAPSLNRIHSLGYHYIVNVKPEGNRSLFEWINGLDLRKIEATQDGIRREIRYVNGVPLNDTKEAPEVNFLEVKETRIRGKKNTTKTFTYVTDHVIDDNNACLLMTGGRSRWKIENETFNTLKNQGYQFEHNFGHGTRYLHTVFAMLMMLAFLIDQIQEATCGLFRSALEKMKTRRAFWETVRSYFHLSLIASWEDLFRAIAESKKFVLQFDSS